MRKSNLKEEKKKSHHDDSKTNMSLFYFVFNRSLLANVKYSYALMYTSNKMKMDFAFIYICFVCCSYDFQYLTIIIKSKCYLMDMSKDLQKTLKFRMMWPR